MNKTEFLDWLLGNPLKVIVIFLVAFITRYLIVFATNRLVRQAFGTSERRDQRSVTISSVLNTITSLVIWGSALLISLAVFGLDIGPLLASAGIVGVAVGFGAQTLVKDYISGLFLILEDQFGIGDIVEFGTVKGKVESVALRTTRVRDDSGVLWYVRNGEILNVANHSQTINREK
jgi:small conductance mechanosensitive channel